MNDLLLLLTDLELFGADIIDKKDFFELLVKAIFNFLVIGYIVRYLYYPATKNKDYLFTYLLISVTVFCLCFLLENVKLELGFALGLFAIFGIIRYRTNTVRIKEMTYLFISIGLSVVNALAGRQVSYAELIFINVGVIAIVYGLEYFWLTRQETSKNIVYEKIENIKPENHQQLMTDLKERTGLKITRVQIGKIDFLRDTAQIRIYFHQDDQDEFISDEQSEERVY